MKTTLKRLGDGDYKLFNTDGSCMATTKESPHKRLSVNNCDDIFKVFSTEEIEVEIIWERDCYSSKGRCNQSEMSKCIFCTSVMYMKDKDGCLILRKI